MKVNYCQGCPFKECRRFSIKHVPATGRAVGFTYRYAYCLRHEQRCLDVSAMVCEKRKHEKYTIKQDGNREKKLFPLRERISETNND